jgi:DNA-directed RNA polymerase sigma subunit (sigma70/sigma32)
VAQPDFSLDGPIGEDEDDHYLERIEDEGPDPEETYIEVQRRGPAGRTAWRAVRGRQ